MTWKILISLFILDVIVDSEDEYILLQDVPDVTFANDDENLKTPQKSGNLTDNVQFNTLGSIVYSPT